MSSHNTLVISDLHLGEDLRPTASSAISNQLALVERNLVQFLSHYACTCYDGKPWRLVINGDMIDFLAVCLLPGEELERRTPEESVIGLGRRPRVALAKLEAVFGRHDSVFRALARFVAAGNLVEIVAGNHDVEFQWAPVQAAFREHVRRLWEVMPAAARRGAPTADQVAERIAFHPWFFYEPGVAWVEHGHHYDENCSFEYSLAPGHPVTREIVSNIDGACTRYVSNTIPDTNPHGQENWSARGFLSYARSLGLRGSWQLARGYYAMSARLLGTWHRRGRSPEVGAARRKRHHERMHALCERWSMSEETLGALDELRREPVFMNFWRLLALLMIDRVILAGVAALALLVVVAALPLLWGLLATTAVIGSSWYTAQWLARFRNTDPVAPLAEVPEHILRHVDAKYVLFGHTHTPVVQSLTGGAAYINSGTWFPTERPGILRSFTHVLIKHGDNGPVASLRQWRDGASRAFTPSLPQVRVASRQLPVAEPAAAAKAEAA